MELERPSIPRLRDGRARREVVDAPERPEDVALAPRVTDLAVEEPPLESVIDQVYRDGVDPPDATFGSAPRALAAAGVSA